MIRSKKLSKFIEINHAFFNRQGGKSIGIYKSLNCGLGSSDKKQDVHQNLNIIEKKNKIKIKQNSFAKSNS